MPSAVSTGVHRLEFHEYMAIRDARRKAMDALIDELDNYDKGNSRVATAMWILEQHIGKSPQHVDVDVTERKISLIEIVTVDTLPAPLINEIPEIEATRALDQGSKPQAEQ